MRCSVGREWVPFLKEEIDELYELVKERCGDAFPDELVYRLIDIVESATIVEIDFGELLFCLDGCKSGYLVLESEEALEGYLNQSPEPINYMLANKTCNIQDPKCTIENFAQWAEETRSLIHDEGYLVLSCSFAEDETSDFYLISSN